nr:NAD(+)--rifampin ADP-ribosyltransferase [Arthrobacter cavernae]
MWGAELGMGEGPGRVNRVEPTGSFEDDPNLTDKKSGAHHEGLPHPRAAAGS